MIGMFVNFAYAIFEEFHIKNQNDTLLQYKHSIQVKVMHKPYLSECTILLQNIVKLHLILNFLRWKQGFIVCKNIGSIVCSIKK
jgi:hypothetical protein